MGGVFSRNVPGISGPGSSEHVFVYLISLDLYARLVFFGRIFVMYLVYILAYSLDVFPRLDRFTTRYVHAA